MGSEVKTLGGMCLFSLIYSYVICMWVTVQYVVLLLFVFLLLITRCMFLLFALFVFFVFYVLLSVLCFCIVSP